ncbi:VWA domain-containing protein [Rhodoferax sp. 4810]|uniref:VWA domain-containing protein n=1 Tax=Thiospirillum jenense TaxID=1653858 RepID=A0A839HB36_9GAMM|nr:VWA domain-containing protein [Thiospirillum jenense]MBB1073133.1 VWA domain-containing protein [Rhodoferax jenense]MBB1124706.1 VWA domain-containing protein [Thiospirillum jenense]
MAISLDKLQTKAPQLVDLRKSVDSTLKNHSSLTGHVAKVALALDYSGSMTSLYDNGWVQKLAERVLALGTAFDDDGDIDIFIFESKAYYVGVLSIDNYQGGVNRLLAKYHMGSTNYAAVMQLIRNHYKTGLMRKLFGSQEKKLPSYVMFITDGEPDSRSDAEKQIREASKEPIFWQFMGVGGTRFEFLSKLDTMSGRFIDNAGFFSITNPNKMSDQTLYQNMLSEYPSWVSQMTAKGIITA